MPAVVGTVEGSLLRFRLLRHQVADRELTVAGIGIDQGQEIPGGGGRATGQQGVGRRAGQQQAVALAAVAGGAAVEVGAGGGLLHGNSETAVPGEQHIQQGREPHLAHRAEARGNIALGGGRAVVGRKYRGQRCQFFIGIGFIPPLDPGPVIVLVAVVSQGVPGAETVPVGKTPAGAGEGAIDQGFGVAYLVDGAAAPAGPELLQGAAALPPVQLDDIALALYRQRLPACAGRQCERHQQYPGQ